MQGCLNHGHLNGFGVQVSYWVGINQVTDSLNYMEAQGNEGQKYKYTTGHVIVLCEVTTKGYKKQIFEIKELAMPDSFDGTYLVVRATQEPGMPVSIGPNGTKINRRITDGRQRSRDQDEGKRPHKQVDGRMSGLCGGYGAPARDRREAESLQENGQQDNVHARNDPGCAIQKDA